MDDQDVIYFNNCRGRDHAGIFGDGAFFDLEDTGQDAKHALDLPVGQDCVVARYADDKHIDVVFDWYALTAERVLDDNGMACRVFFGTLLSTEILPKSKATAVKRYAVFFNVNGHFKRSSVILEEVPGRHRPTSERKKQTYCAEEVVASDGRFIEGATRRITVNAYERNAAARTTCIDHYGSTCCICGIDFGIMYGKEADGHIHIHHLRPLSELKSSYEIDPIQDLRPVCPNCHAVLHLGDVTRSMEDVKAMLNSNRKRK
ncbi:MAG: hypothetical protein SVJ22_01830 [Halobacteriota archaeon]|nr:hypothetical protein [Halobacteriota archaeon]